MLGDAGTGEVPYSSKAVANFFLSLANSKGEDLDQLKLQKLIYFAHGWHLAFRDQPLIPDRIEAWQYGPVVPSLYYELLDWGSAPIKGAIVEMLSKLNDSTNQVDFFQYVPNLQAYGAENDAGLKFTEQLLRQIYRYYGHLTGPQLSYLTHEKNGPWEWARKSKSAKDKPVIPDPEFRKHFRQKLEEHARSAQVDAP